jgi:hypothetical protein
VFRFMNQVVSLGSRQEPRGIAILVCDRLEGGDPRIAVGQLFVQTDNFCVDLDS